MYAITGNLGNERVVDIFEVNGVEDEESIRVYFSNSEDAEEFESFINSNEKHVVTLINAIDNSVECH